jgi:hypothetical protein
MLGSSNLPDCARLTATKYVLRLLWLLIFTLRQFSVMQEAIDAGIPCNFVLL